MKALLFLSLFISFSVFAGNINKEFTTKSFADAKKSEQYIRFDMKSTKAGMFTTSFTGFVKDFNINTDKKNDMISGGTLKFKVLSLDTDSDGRNEKMHNKCFSHTKFPELSVKFSNSIKYNTESDIEGIINVRGKNKPIKIHMKVTKTGDTVQVQGTAKVKLSELEIPDPSIFIASVSDEVVILFSIKI